jgi:tetratricopeptide (TPR) repeat protein
MKFYTFLFLTLIVNVFIFAQNIDEKKLIESAKEKMKNENFDEALDDWLQLYQVNPKNVEYQYNIAVCYLNTNINKTKAIPYLENVVKSENHNPNAEFLLARAYQYANRFTEAIEYFQKFKNNGKGSPENLKLVDLEIQHCFNARELIKYPVNVTFQNLGKNINSEYADFYPFVDEKESFLVFNSNRPLNNKIEKLPNGQYPTSIFISYVKNGEYSEASVIGEPVCKGNSGEEVVGMSSNGKILIIHKNGKLYFSKYNEQQYKFQRLEPLPSSINSSGDVIAASINNEVTEIYFASNRKGGYGGTDIYVCRYLNGKWLEPENLGPSINTEYDEDFPNLSPDEKYLFFSSKGHGSMGGYDIFKAVRNSETNKFEKPKNIGYPINTSYDDMNFRISKNGRYGYIASVRGNSEGDYDIYRVIFNDEEPEFTLITGEIKAEPPIQDLRDVFIQVTQLSNGDLIGNYVPNPNTGRYVIILPPGKYKLTVEYSGYKTYETKLEILDKSSFQSEITLNIQLNK